MRNRWKKTVALALSGLVMFGCMPAYNDGGGGLLESFSIVASAADKTLAVGTIYAVGDTPTLPSDVSSVYVKTITASRSVVPVDYFSTVRRSYAGYDASIGWNADSFVHASDGSQYWSFYEGSQTQFTALKCTGGDGTSGNPYTFAFVYDKLSITPSLTIADINYGETISPVVTGNPGNGAVTYYFNTQNVAKTAGGWTTTRPTSIGTYYAYADVAANGDYTDGSTDVISFKIIGYVSFNANGLGEDPAKQSVAPNGKVTKPEVDTFIDNADMAWNLEGWYDNADCTGTAFDFDNTVITANKTLYAKWEKAPYKVLCSDSVTDAFKLNLRRAKAGDNITLTLKNGYTFNGNLTVKNGSTSVNVSKSGNVYSFTMPSANVDVSVPANSVTKAEYTITKGSNIAEVKVNNGNGTKANVGDVVAFKVNVPKNEDGTDQIFKKIHVTGTADKPEISEIAYDSFCMIMPSANITISAEYSELEDYTVFYFGSNATNARLVSNDINYDGELEPDVVLGNETAYSMLAKAPAPDNGNIKFKYKDEDGWSAWKNIAVVTNPNTSDLKSQATKLMNGDKVLIVTGKTNMSGVLFVNEKDTVKRSFAVAGTNIALPTAPTKDEYVFKGWENRSTGQVYTTGTVKAPADGTLVLTAKWERQNCTVTFDSNGGTAVSAQSVSYGGKAVKPNAPTKSGMAFVRWVYAEDDANHREGSEYNFNETVTKNIKLRAEWKHVHSYGCYALNSPIFGGGFDEYCNPADKDNYRLPTLHIRLCGSWDDYQIEAHHFDKDGKCACGYQKEFKYFTLHDLNSGTSKQVAKGKTYEQTAPEKNANGEVFSCWCYLLSGSNELQMLTTERKLSFVLPEDDHATELSIFAVYRAVPVELTEPKMELIARPALAGSTKAIQFTMEYELPKGWKATECVLKAGDNDMLFYFTPGALNFKNLWKNSFLNLFGKKQLGGYYCFEEIDDSLFSQISTLFTVTFKKIDIYYPREDNVMTKENISAHDLADKMYNGKGITLLDMELLGVQLNTPGKTGYIYKNIIPAAMGYGLPKDNDHLFYAMGYLKCVDTKGKSHTYIMDAVATSANSVANEPIVSNEKHEK